MKTDYRYPENYKGVVKVWSHDDMQFTILKTDAGHHCGYVRFESRPVIEKGYYGFLTYVPVHGGITYADQGDDETMVYGFDCDHCDDHCDDRNNEQLRDLEWLGEECFRMGRAIALASQYEQRYENADSNTRAGIIQEYHNVLRGQGIGFVLQDNFGAMINVLSGRL